MKKGSGSLIFCRHEADWDCCLLANMDHFLWKRKLAIITKREETKFQRVEPRALENHSQNWALIKELAIYAQMNFRIALDQWLLCDSFSLMSPTLTLWPSLLNDSVYHCYNTLVLLLYVERVGQIICVFSSQVFRLRRAVLRGCPEHLLLLSLIDIWPWFNTALCLASHHGKFSSVAKTAISERIS